MIIRHDQMRQEVKNRIILENQKNIQDQNASGTVFV